MEIRIFIYLFIYSFIVGFGVIMVIMQRGCGVHRKPVLEIAALQFFTFFIHLSRLGGLVVHGARECLFHRDREREEPPRRQGQGKGLSQVFKYLPFFSFMLVVHVCVHLLPCRFLGPLIIGIKSVGRGSGFPFLFLFLFFSF